MPRLKLELLEARTLPAVTSSLAGGTLSVLLDAANDFATISVVGNDIRVIDGVSPTSYSLADVQRINVEGESLKGQRLVLRDALALPDTLVATQLSDILVRGDYSAASIDLTAGNTLTLNPGASLSTRRIAAGADPLTAASTGDSGDLQLEAPAITLADGAALLAHADSGFASGDVTLTALNTIELDFVLGLPLFQTLNGKATITIGDADIRGDAITLTATAESVKTADQDDPAPGPVSEVLLEVLDEQPLANSFRAVFAEPTATVTLRAGADLRSDGDLTARATARSEVELIADTNGGVIVYGSSSPTSSVTFESGSTVQAGGTFDARALVENDLDVTALVPSGGANVASAAYGKARSVAAASVQDGATVTAGSAVVRADADNTFRTRAIADGFDIPESSDAGVGAALAVGDYSSVVTTSVLGTLTVTGDASVEASSTTESQVRSFASVAAEVIPGVLGTSVEDLLADYDLSEVTDATPGGSDSAVVQVGAAVTLAFTENRAEAELGGTVTAENVTVSAEAKDDLRTSATSSAGAADLGAVGGALIVSDGSNTATATVAPAAVVDASEALSVTATATVAGESPELNLADVIDGAENAGEALRDGLDPVGSFLTGVLDEWFDTTTTFVHTGGHVEKSGAAGVSGGASFYTLDNAATAFVGADASINQSGTVTDEQSVSVTATATVDASHLAGQVSALNFRSQDGLAVLTAGGFAETIDQSNTANAFIDDGVALSAATDVMVAADTITNVLAVVASGSTDGGSISVRGAGTALELTGGAAAWVEESAVVETGGAINVTANNTSKVLNAAAVVADVGLVTLAGSGATNEIKQTTRALIADVNGIPGGAGEVTAGGELLVQAKDTSALLALSGGAALPVSGSGAQAAIGVAEASNVAANTVLAEISGTTVSAQTNVTVGANSDPRLVALAAGGVGAEAFTLTNPGAYNQSTGSAEAVVRDAVVSSEGKLVVAAADTTNAQALAGSGAGATVASFGTAAALNDIADALRAGIEGSTIDATRVAVGAGSEAKFFAISGVGTGADTGAGSFSESTNEIAGTIDAHISGSTLTATGAVGVAALGAPTVLALSGAGAGGGTAAGAWAIADNAIGGSINATLENTDVAAGGLGVAARSGGEIDAIAVGGSGAGTASIAGSDSANAISTAVAAVVRGKVGEHEIMVNGAVGIAAVTDTRVSALSGGGAGAGTAAGGAALSTNTLTGSLTAALDGGKVNAHAGSVRVTSTLTGDVESFAVGGAGAEGFAVGGSVSKNVLDHNAEARLSEAVVNRFNEVTNPGSVVVSAVDASSARSRAGGVAGAGGVAFGAAVGTNDLGGSARAVVSGAAVRGSDVTVAAYRAATLNVQTLSGSGAGTAAVAGSSSTNINSGATTAEAYGSVLGASGAISVVAAETSSTTAFAGGISGAGELAAGAAFATNTLEQSVAADLRGSIVAAGGAITVGSASTGTHEVDAVGGAGAGSLALIGSEATTTLKTQVNTSVSGSGLSGGTIAVTAGADHTHDLDAGVLAGGIGAVGGSAANVHQETATKAVVENSALAGGAIAIGADANFERTRANAVAGSVGGIDVQAATAGVTADNDVSAGLGAGTTITNSGAVAVAARLREALEVNATGATLGAVVVGAVTAEATEIGTVEAYVAQGASVTGVNALNVTSTADVTGEADGTAANGGMAGTITVNRAAVVISPKVHAFLDGEVGASGKVMVLADSSADASADLFSLSVGSLAAGRSDATAAIMSDAEASVGAGSVLAGDVQITARHNFGPDGPTGGSARAIAHAPTASLVGNYTGADPNAIAAAKTRASIDGADVIGVNVTVQAQTSNVADADALALSLGAIAVGTSDPDAEAGGGSEALVAGRILTQGLTVSSETDARADAAGDGVSGGLGVGVTGVSATATVAPTVTAEVDAAVLAVNTSILAESTGDAHASAWGAGANLATVGVMKADASVRPTVSASVGGSGKIELEGGSLTVEARHNVGTTLGARAEADAPVNLGLKTVTGASAVAESLADVSVSLDDGGRVSADGAITFRAESVNIADAEAAALNLGFVVVGSNNADATASGRTTAKVHGTVGDAMYSPDSVTVEAVGVNEATATADAPGGGLILGVNGASADAIVAPTLAAGVTSTGSIAAFGTIRIGTESETEARAETTAFTVGTVLAVGSTPAVATVEPTLSAFVRGGGRVHSLRGDVVVEALHNYSGAEPLPGRGAFADSAAAGGGFVSVNSSDARATSAAVVDAFTAGGSTINAGMSVSLRARSKDRADASATGVTGAGFGVAASFAEAKAGGTVTARVEEATVQAGGDLEVLALGLAVTDAVGGATAGAFAGGGGAAAGAYSAPEVRAFVNGRALERDIGDAPIYVGGDVAINAFAQGGATADADGIAAGGLAVGTSYATARWLPDVSAHIEVPARSNTGDLGADDDGDIGGVALGVQWDVVAGGSIRVQAHSNYTESGAKDLGRRARATAEASADGAASVAGAQAIAEAASVVHAWVGAGSTLYADGSVVIRARSRDRAESEADGVADGLLAAGGTILSQTTVGTDTRAYTADATGDDVTRIEAFDKLQVRSDSDLVGDSQAVGGKGGLIGSGNASALTVAREPLTLARVGDHLLFDSEDAAMRVTAESRARLTSESDQLVRGAIAGNHTLAKAQLLGADTQAQVGNGVNIHVDSFELLAIARDVFVEADSSATTYFDLFMGTTAEAVVDAEVNVLAEVGGTEDAPTTIHATGTGGLTFRAGADNVSTYALASVSDRGIIGKKTAIADNDRRVDVALTISDDADLDNDIPESAGGTEIYEAYFLGGDYDRQALRNGKDDGIKRGVDDTP